MVFSSLLFLFTFLPVVLIAYFISPRPLRNLVLFIASLIFYAWGEPIYVVIMIFSTVVDYSHGLLVSRFKASGQMKKARLVVASSMIINLALLCFFKYSDFIIQNINAVLGLNIPLLNIPLPIGISFYTFQTMSYTIDVYRGHAEAQKNIISFGAYVALFPQLIAGPIVQYKTIAQQLDCRRITSDRFSDGASRFIIGLGKKVLLANNIGYLWDSVSSMNLSTLPALTAWIGAVAFAFQIYFDFSGYSDMAIGLGKIMGFEFLENFNYPYISKSITEFWRRWHISLGTWFREYVYIPLGGNRRGIAVQIRNIAVVWLLTGIWHGASWNFILWGAYFGVLLMIEKLFLLKWLQRLPAAIAHIYTLSLVLFSWVIFAFDDMSRIGTYFKAMLGLNNGVAADNNSIYMLYTNAVMIIILAFASTPLPRKICNRILYKKQAESSNSISTKSGEQVHIKTVKSELIRGLAFGVICILSVAYLVNSSYNPFLYFRF